jgi:hypothetical protein
MFLNTFANLPFPHWARKLRTRLRHWLTQHHPRDNTGYHKKIGALQALDPQLFSRHDPFRACQFSLTVIYPSLDRYTQAARVANHHLRQGLGISNHWCDYASQTLRLESFFIDRTTSQQRHLEPVDEVTAFKQTALEFFSLYRANSAVRFGDHSHNTRVLSKFEDQLCLLTDRLFAYSLG